MNFFSLDSQSIVFYEDGLLIFRDVLSHHANKLIDLKVYQLEKFYTKFSPDGSQLLIIPAKQPPILLDLATGKEIQRINIPDFKSAYWGEFASDGHSVFIGSRNDWAYRWDLQRKEVVQKYYHGAGFWHFAITKDMKTLIAGAPSSLLGVWDVNSGERLIVLPPGMEPFIGNILVLPDEKHALICDGAGGRITEIASGKLLQVLDPKPTDYHYLYFAAISASANLLITNAYGFSPEAELWDASTWQHLGSLSLTIPSDNDNPRSVDISPDGRYAASLMWVDKTESQMSIWDVSQRQLIRSRRWPDHFIYAG